MYTAKQSSADGRKLIWKLSAQMVLEKPVFGYGYDSFEKEYNQFQAEYIKTGKASEGELRYAAPVKMAYNEPLQNAVEGGLPGLLLWLSVIVSLVIPPFLQNKKKTGVKQPDTEPEQNMLYACYSGIVAFAFMSVVNFTIQAIPVMCLFVLYAAILTAMPCNRKAATNSRFAILGNHVLFNKVARVAKASLILIACLCGFHVYTLANADRQQKIAIDLNRQGSSKKALTIMPALERKLSGYDSYWKSYGTINLQEKEYSVALSKFLRAKELSSSPDIYLNIGYCFGKLGQYAEAVKAYEQAVLFDPGKFANRYRLMNACMQNSDTVKAVSTAQGIIALKPKIHSDKVKGYKNAAIRLLQNLKIPFPEDRVFTYDLKLN
jgi:O-antigen polymerase